MVTIRFHGLPVLVLALLASHLPQPLLSQSRATRDSMTGVWCGSANVVVSWTAQKKLGVRLVVPSSGEITGNVGDARLSGGRLEANRGTVSRMLNIKTDYIVVANLEGPIIAADGITRRTVKMPLNWTGSEFRGGIHTDGWQFGGKDHMILSASELVLRRWIVPGKRDIGYC